MGATGFDLQGHCTTSLLSFATFLFQDFFPISIRDLVCECYLDSSQLSITCRVVCNILIDIFRVSTLFLFGCFIWGGEKENCKENKYEFFSFFWFDIDCLELMFELRVDTRSHDKPIKNVWHHVLARPCLLSHVVVG